MSLKKCFLCIVLLCLITKLNAQSILIVDYNNSFSSDRQSFNSQVYNYLLSTRPSVTRVTTPGTSISNAYNQVWLFGDPGPNSPANLAPYINYVNAGGALYVQSEVGCCNNQAAFVQSLIQQLVINGTSYQHVTTYSGTFDYQPDSIVTCNPFIGTGTALRPFIGVPNQNRLFGVTNLCSSPYTIGMAAGAMFASCDMISGQGALISLGDFNMLTLAASCTGGGIMPGAVLDPNPVNFIADVFPRLLNCQYKTDTLDIGKDSIFNCSVSNFTIQSNITNPSFSYLWSTGGTGTSITINTPGTYYLNVTNTAGCNMVDTIVISVNNNSNQTINHVLCPGGTYNFKGRIISSAGTYYDTIFNPTGCDTITTLNVTIQNLSSTTNNQVICQGNSYLFGGNNLTVSGTYYDTLKNIFGCDSLAITLNLAVVSPQPSITNQTICLGTTYNFRGTILNNTGTYYDTLKSSAGCDSIRYTLNLTVSPILNGTISATICAGQVYIFAGQNLTQAGTYYDTTKTAGGCDTATTLTLTVNPSYNLVLDTNYCIGDSIYLVNTFVSSPGIHTFQLYSNRGCDSIVNYNVTEQTDCHLYIYIPNSFTPDGDGGNDLFKPVIDGDILDYEFYIFNRWGQLIYFSNNVTDKGWDGNYKNQLSQTGVYIWEIRYKTPFESGRKMKHGFVELLK